MSERAKYTDGPWRVDGTVGLGAYGVWTAYATHPGHDGAGYESQICSVLPAQTDLPRSQRDANARLISLSPRMFDALRLVREEMLRQTVEGTVDHDTSATILDHIDLIITEAIGQEVA